MKVLLALFLLNFSLIANENWRTDFKAALAEALLNIEHGLNCTSGSSGLLLEQ